MAGLTRVARIIVVLLLVAFISASPYAHYSGISYRNYPPIAVVIAFFVCWTPFHIQRLFYIYGYDHPQFHVINEHLFNVARALFYVSATVNPILCKVMSARYRVAFHETLFCRHRDDRNNFDHTGRETTLSTCVRPKSSFYSEPRPTSKVDYVKDEYPFCIETKIDERTMCYYPNGTYKTSQDDVEGSL